MSILDLIFSIHFDFTLFFNVFFLVSCDSLQFPKVIKMRCSVALEVLNRTKDMGFARTTQNSKSIT